MVSDFPNFRKNSLLPTILADKLIFILIFIFIFDFVLFPAPILAENLDYGTQIITDTAEFAENIADSSSINKLPINKQIKKKQAKFYKITAYTSEESQCDNSPCITANGFNVCVHGIEDTIAANFLKFGTKVKIPDLYGDKVFTVRDRMNKRYSNRVDIWFKDKKQAIDFGFKVARIEVLE